MRDHSSYTLTFTTGWVAIVPGSEGAGFNPVTDGDPVDTALDTKAPPVSMPALAALGPGTDNIDTVDCAAEDKQWLVHSQLQIGNPTILHLLYLLLLFLPYSLFELSLSSYLQL